MEELGGWEFVLDAVREQIGRHAWEAWFRSLEGRVEDERVVVRCPDRFCRDWIRERYGDVLARVVPAGRTIDFEVGEAPRPERRGPAARPSAAAAAPRPRSRAASAEPWTFDSFVAGPNSALALEAARAIARGEAGRCSPLFLQAGPGLGKTHLCRAIRRELGADVVYRSSEEFTSEVTGAMRSGEMARVRHRFRRAANVLILEDVQFLAGKRATQTELFHTLDHLLSRGRPVVVSADRAPQELDELDAQLRSRLSTGLIACIAPPELHTRREILRDRAARGGVRVDGDCLDMLANRPVSSVRDLVSGLNQVIARASLLSRPIDAGLVAESLAAVDVPGAPRTIEEILRLVAGAYGLDAEQMRSRSRRRQIVRPRQFAMYLCRRYTDASLKDIGRAFNRDHTSVMYAVDVVERRVAEQPQLRYQLEALARKL